MTATKTIFLDADGNQLGEVPRIFAPMYCGLLFEVAGDPVTVTSVDWEITDESTTCRLGVAPTPLELLDH
jgi:hypothetical protein